MSNHNTFHALDMYENMSNSSSPGHSALGSPEPQAGSSSLHQPITGAEYQAQPQDDTILERIMRAAAQTSKMKIEGDD